MFWSDSTITECVLSYLRGVSRFSNFFFIWRVRYMIFSHNIILYKWTFFVWKFFHQAPPFPPPPKKPWNFNVFKNNSSLSIFDLETWKLFYFVHIPAFYNSTILIIEICLPKNIYDEKKNNKKKILIFGTFFHFTPTHAEEHHINRSYFYRKHYSEQNKTNLKSLSQKLKEESAFEVEKSKFSNNVTFSRRLFYKLRDSLIFDRSVVGN